MSHNSSVLMDGFGQRKGQRSRCLPALPAQSPDPSSASETLTWAASTNRGDWAPPIRAVKGPEGAIEEVEGMKIEAFVRCSP